MYGNITELSALNRLSVLTIHESDGYVNGMIQTFKFSISCHILLVTWPDLRIIV